MSILTLRQRLILLAPLAAILLPFLLVPSVWGFVASFTNYVPFQLDLHGVGLRNYTNVITDHEFGAAIRNTVVFTLTTVTVAMVLGFGIAYLLRRPFRGRDLVRVLLLVPWLVSPIANGVMWHFLLNGKVGLLNALLGMLKLPDQPSLLGVRGWALPMVMLVEIWRTAPLVTFLLWPGLTSIPDEQWEQATLEGATLWQRLRLIALPPVWPLMLTVTLLLAGNALGAFDSVLVLTGGGPGTETVTLGLFSFTRGFKVFDWPIATTSAWLIVAAVAFLGFVYVLLSNALLRETHAQEAT